MAWSDVFKYARSLAGKAGVDTAKPETRADDGLPLGARIGSVLSIQQTPFIRAQTFGSLISMVRDTDTMVHAVSRLKLGLSGNLFRLYTTTGDNDSDERFLQIYQGADGELKEFLFCTTLTRIIPETNEDQIAFMGQEGYGLGEKNYSIQRQQMADMGWEEAELVRVFGDNDTVDYQRDAGDPSVDFVPPFHGSEIRVDDSNGEHGLEQEIYFMPYVREIGDGKEYLLISTEIVGSRDGDKNNRSIHVDLMIGLPIDKNRITIV